MVFLSIPVLYYPDDYDKEKYEELGKKLKFRKGTMMINIHQICQYHGTEQGTTVLSLSDGTLIESSLSEDKFRERLKDAETIVDIIVPNNN
jgi:hypothetical protein